VYTAEDLKRQEIQSSLKSIVETSEGWLGRIRKREFRVRLAKSFLTFVLVFLVVAAIDLGSILSQYGPQYFATFIQDHPARIAAFALTALAGSLISGVLAYFLLRRNDEARLKELSSLVAQMKQKISEDQQEKSSTGGQGEGITGSALFLADKILALLPGLVRRRNQDSLLFGFVAFILAEFIGQNLAVALLIGVIVWIYFRYETRKSYDQEISRIEEQKRIFEQRKKDFIETL
jgi:hypothetical protein